MLDPGKPRKTLFKPELRRRGIYILPSLFTTGALFAGFFAIVQAIQGHFSWAALAVFAAMILDGLDGRVARLVHAQSDFGAEYDSLADMVSFGVAPALVMYKWALSDMRIGLGASFFYCLCAALRLARFNTNIEVADKRYFQGLPSPAAAALTAGFVWVMIDAGISGEFIHWLAAFITIFAGVTMVSNFRFYSFKGINLRRRVPFVMLAVLALMIVLVFSYPIVPFLLFCVYAVSGYALAVSKLLSSWKNAAQTKNR